MLHSLAASMISILDVCMSEDKATESRAGVVQKPTDMHRTPKRACACRNQSSVVVNAEGH